MAPPDCGVGAQSGATAPVSGGMHRATCCGAEAASRARVERHGPFISLLNGEQKWAVEGQLLQKNRIRRPGPERSPPGRRDASNEKFKNCSGVQNEVRAFWPRVPGPRGAQAPHRQPFPIHHLHLHAPAALDTSGSLHLQHP